jgi:hypothetical protein
VGSTIVDILSLCSEKIERESQQFVSMTLHFFTFFGSLSYKTPFRRFPTDGSLGNADGSYGPGGIGLRHWLMLLLILPSFWTKKQGKVGRLTCRQGHVWTFGYQMVNFDSIPEAFGGCQVLENAGKGHLVPPELFIAQSRHFAVPWLSGQVPKPFRRKGIRLMDMD